jgi:bifunctional non-homologous end joining protein LigD
MSVCGEGNDAFVTARGSGSSSVRYPAGRRRTPRARYSADVPQGIERSNLGKVFWPKGGLTKGDLLDYFDAVAPFLLPAVRDRPLTVIRFPDGIGGMRFYQKDTPKYAPSWVRTVTIHAGTAKRDVRYPLCNSKRTLLWFANQAAIELHPWISRTDRLERPDFLVFDLDPPEDRYDVAVEVAHVMREALREFGLEAVAKTSGSKGVHVFVPVRREYDYRAVRTAADFLAATVGDQIPDVATTAFLKADRGGRLFLDTGRVAPGAHVATVYSPRAGEAATVSFPVPWEDLKSAVPQDFTIQNVPAILRREGDRWKDLLPPRQRLDRLLEAAGYR